MLTRFIGFQASWMINARLCAVIFVIAVLRLLLPQDNGLSVTFEQLEAHMWRMH